MPSIQISSPVTFCPADIRILKFEFLGHVSQPIRIERNTTVIVNLTVYHELMQFICDCKMSLAYTNLEKDIWDAIYDVRTLAKLVVLLWYGQNFRKPVMQVVWLQMKHKQSTQSVGHGPSA